ncbi:hypothetical protein GCM10008098_25760 [Rhodanobacter panaciterrae]|uniref:ABC transporter n=1 Tax=Rhodanobacter panaciterrae TaxID=490572 RepID=A0ABQ3A393_9GAMM|nr:hypothetical protein [Rhodanobacter panaciterrae]GGY30922.1 hypothetical protein GCM10008098_25760 [Rhodanobacter panaciterrae]
MNPRTAVLTLWFATARLTRWMIGMFYVLMIGLAIIVSHDLPAAEQVFPIALMLGLATGFWWVLFASKALSLAIDARQLRLPGIQRGIVAGLLLLALMTIALPAIVLGLCGGDAGILMVLLALAASAGSAYMLLPRSLAIVACISPTLLHSFWRQLHLPGLHDPHFTSAAWLVVLVLLVVLSRCWREQLRLENPYRRGFNMPLALHVQYGRMSAQRNLHAGVADHAAQGRPWPIPWRPDWLWLQPQPGMRRLGPDHPVNSLRMMLGGLFTPLSAIGWLQALSRLLIISACVVLGALVLHYDGHRRYPTHPSHDAATMYVDWFGAIGGMMITLVATTLLRQRWMRMNAELPLLALLPNLNGSRNLRHSLLLATLLPPLFCQAVLLLLMLVAALALHYSGTSMLLIVMAQCLVSGVLIASTLCLLSGHPQAVRGVQVLLVLLVLALSVPPLLPPVLLGMDKHPWGADALALLPLGLLWLLLASMLCWLGYRGWRGLLQRPHPFLPT